MSPFWILLKLWMTETVVTATAIRFAKLQSNHHHQQTNTRLLRARCLSCCPTNSVRSLEGKSTMLHGPVHPKLTWESSHL